MLAHAHANIYIYIYRCSSRRQPGPSTACVQTARACDGVGVYTFYTTCMAAAFPVLAHARAHTRTHTHTHIFCMCTYMPICIYAYACLHLRFFSYAMVCYALQTYRQTRTYMRTHTRKHICGWMACTVEAGGCTVAVNIYTYI